MRNGTYKSLPIQSSKYGAFVCVCVCVCVCVRMSVTLIANNSHWEFGGDKESCEGLQSYMGRLQTKMDWVLQAMA